MYHDPREYRHKEFWQRHLVTGMEDDSWQWDWTSMGAQGAKSKVSGKIIAKEDGVWAADGLIEAVAAVAPEVSMKSRTSDGKRFSSGDVLIQFSGPARLVLAIERPFLNLSAYASGIATATSLLVEKVKKACPKRTPRVALTRKTLPGYRDIAIHGVRSGGGHAHRVSLSGGVLIKENHIASAGGIRKAIEGVRQQAPHGLKIEVEVRNLQEMLKAVQAGAEGLLLDNFSPDHVRAALKALNQQGGLRPFVEVSGGINEDTISKYAMEGVDVISVGSITHSVRSIDFSLLLND